MLAGWTAAAPFYRWPQLYVGSTMLVNCAVNSVLKTPPCINPDQAERLITWLKIVGQSEFPPVFFAQLEMLDEILAIEKQIQESNVLRKRLKIEIPELKRQNRFDAMKSNQEEITRQEQIADCLRYYRDCVLLVGDTMASKIV